MVVHASSPIFAFVRRPLVGAVETVAGDDGDLFGVGQGRDESLCLLVRGIDVAELD
jgi:hypothetical protein